MRFVYRDASAERELEMRLGHPDTTVGDLAAALGCPAGVHIDGRAADPATGLAEKFMCTPDRPVGRDRWFSCRRRHGRSAEPTTN